jgi:hypothetical protein
MRELRDYIWASYGDLNSSWEQALQDCVHNVLLTWSQSITPHNPA